jgi:hypothetical protein
MQEILERCVAAEPKLRSLGVRRIALFGTATYELVEFEPGQKTFDRFLTLSRLR